MRKPNEVPKSLKSVDVKALLRQRGVFMQLRLNQEMKAAAKPIARRILSSQKKQSVKTQDTSTQKYQHFTDDVVQEYVHKQVHIIEVLERRFEQKVQQFITKMIDSFLKTLESEVATEKDAKKFLKKDYFSDNEDDLLTQAQLDFAPLLADQAVLAGQEAYKLLNHDDIYTPFKLRETISQNVRKFTESLMQTDRDTLTNIIQQGIENGETMPEIRNQIELRFEDISKNQAQRITYTEVARISNQASIDAYEQSGLVEGKQWVIFGASDECEQYDGQIVYGLHKGFYDGENEFQDGDPPLHPNCKCIVIPILTSD